MMSPMSLLPFGELPPYRARRFLPAGLDLGNWNEVSPHFDRIEQAIGACGTVADLERWIVDSGELVAALDEERARRYIAKTCHTEDSSAEKSYLDFIENIDPALKPRLFSLARLFLAHALRSELPKERYGVFDRATALQVELFREQNIPLETEEARFSNEYTNINGSLSVRFREEERTLVAMSRFQEEPERAVREESWRLVADRRLREVDRIDALFDQLLEVRGRIARNAGFKDYVGYAFRARGRFDYTPDDCLRFHDAIESEVMPLLRRLQSDRRASLGVDRLRPWDLAVDPLNRPPLRPYSDCSRLESGTQEIFNRLDPELSEGFQTLRDRRLLDLQNRKGKAPGGYQYTLSESRLPFIFMNSVGLQRDVETLLHEAGHAFHALACRGDDIPLHREPPIEFCEVASMSMELLGADHLDVFYPPADVIRARRVHLEGVIGVFPWIATIDAFQHWLYSHPGHTHEDRRTAWTGLMDRFGGDVDWTGHESARANLWHKQLHLFLHPFYYVEYGIAQLGALQVWANSRRDSGSALKQYLTGLSLGGSRPLPELFSAAGCRFDFSRQTVRPLVQLVAEELERLPVG
jgi:oligoendopeptidase F